MPTSQGHPLSDAEEAESNTRSHPQILPPLPSPPPPTVRTQEPDPASEPSGGRSCENLGKAERGRSPEVP